MSFVPEKLINECRSLALHLTSGVAICGMERNLAIQPHCPLGQSLNLLFGDFSYIFESDWGNGKITIYYITTEPKNKTHFGK